MHKQIKFDHTYTADPNHRFFNALKTMGFNINTNMVKHPDFDCRFVYFEGGYLEFVHSPNKNKMKRSPGLSFGVQSNLYSLYQKYKKLGVKCSYSHRNYLWKENSKDKLPGWNFLNFDKLGFNTIYPWFTEYEPAPWRKKRPMPKNHANGVRKIIGHEFILNNKGYKFFKQILGQPLKDEVRLKCGTILYFKKGKINYHSKVILGTKNLAKTSSRIKNHEKIDFNGKEALLIRNPSSNKRMWDLVIVD